jgi:hypothetical protein
MEREEPLHCAHKCIPMIQLSSCDSCLKESFWIKTNDNIYLDTGTISAQCLEPPTTVILASMSPYAVLFMLR